MASKDALNGSLHDSFWEVFAGQVMLSGENIVFTAKGKAELGPHLEDVGIDLGHIKTLLQFKQAIRVSIRNQFADLCADIEVLHRSHGVCDQDKAFAADVLGYTPAPMLGVVEPDGTMPKPQRDKQRVLARMAEVQEFLGAQAQLEAASPVHAAAGSSG